MPDQPDSPPNSPQESLQIADADREVVVTEQRQVFSGAVWNVRRDTFTLDQTPETAGSTDTTDALEGAEWLTREYIEHCGAVAIVALDDDDQVCLIRQYRHSVGQELWEIPAGLLDVDDEPLLATAQRELAEETDLRAREWTVLAEHYPTAGSSSEGIRVFLARGLSDVPESERHTRDAEEAHLVKRWVPLSAALDGVLVGEIRNANTVIGVMAAHLHLSTHPVHRRLDDPWLGRDGV